MARPQTTALLRRASLALAVGTALWGAAGQAQDAAVGECTGLADATAEIACLRAALEASRKSLAEAEQGRTDAPSAVPARSAQRVTEASQAVALGDEQVPRAAVDARAETGDPERIAATVTASRTDPRGLLVVQLDNGQIWRQNDGTDLPVRIGEDERVRVEIARSGFGGYRMNFPDLGRRIAVSRLR